MNNLNQDRPDAAMLAATGIDHDAVDPQFAVGFAAGFKAAQQAAQPVAGEPVAWTNAAMLKSAAVSRERGGPFDTHAWSEGPTAIHDVALYTAPQAPRSRVLAALIQQRRRLETALELACSHLTDEQAAEVAAAMPTDTAAPAPVGLSELLAVVKNFEVTGPDDDGLVWLVLRGNGTSGKAMFNLGPEHRAAAQVALLFEQQRREAIEAAHGIKAGKDVAK